MSGPKDCIFAKDDRIRMSALGAERCPGIANKTGVVVRTSVDGRRYKSLGVRFDGNKGITNLHPDYIELVSVELGLKAKEN
jgi:hypothetical protein